MFTNNGEAMASHLKDLAKASISFYKDLLAAGFDEQQALAMVLEMQRAIFTGAVKGE